MVAMVQRPDALLEVLVLLFQGVGFVSLFLVHFLTTNRAVARARLTFLIALIGLGVAGSACSHFDSEFALFAGGTLTILLVGITLPSGGGDPATSSIPTFGIDSPWRGDF